MKNSLTVIVPCFNEENTIYELLTRVLNQVVVREIIVINDASTDKTSEIIKKIKDSRVVYFENSKNLGKGASVKKGFQLATADFVLIQDADLEYSPEEYSRLLKPLIDGFADAVFGSRFLTYESRRALYFWHRVGNKFLTLLSNMFTNIDLTDMETCYKVMRTDFAKRMDIKENRFGLEPELTAKLAKMNARIYEVAISYRGRTYQEGKKITWKDGFSAIRCIVKYNLFK
jgi:glycosyltransferase involved in cell wall biosynthesis